MLEAPHITPSILNFIAQQKPSSATLLPEHNYQSLLGFHFLQYFKRSLTPPFGYHDKWAVCPTINALSLKCTGLAIPSVTISWNPLLAVRNRSFSAVVQSATNCSTIVHLSKKASEFIRSAVFSQSSTLEWNNLVLSESSICIWQLPSWKNKFLSSPNTLTLKNVYFYN